jgi:hypothetical protein
MCNHGRIIRHKHPEREDKAGVPELALPAAVATFADEALVVLAVVALPKPAIK